MVKFKRGFTLIEVALFLVVTGALFVGITAGVQNSIFQQRYNDSVQNFVEFLRGIYSETTNVQSAGDGRSEQAIYGKLVVFGESEDFAGNCVNGSEEAGDCVNTTGAEDRNVVFVYDVIGNIGSNLESGNIIEALKELKANVVTVADKNEDDGSVTSVKAAGVVESYMPKWSAQIEPACTETGCSYEGFKGMVLVVRHPQSGTVYTYYSDEVIDVNEKIRNMNLNLGAGVSIDMNVFEYVEDGTVKNYLDGFEMERIDFCINPNGGESGGLRRDVRIIKGARNASGIETIAEDSSNNACRREE